MRINNESKKFIKEAAITIAIAIILSKLITTFIFVMAVIPSESMVNTLNVGDKVFVDKICIHFSNIERGDIIVFEHSENTNNSKYLIKRVIGLPGETIEIKKGILYVNGNKVEETYLGSNNELDFGPYNVPDNKYFVLGDNRTNSFDSRYWEETYVDFSSIIGKAKLKVSNGIETIRNPIYSIQ